MMNENAVSNILIDVDFLEEELKRIGRPHLSEVFVELRLVSSTPIKSLMLLLMRFRRVPYLLRTQFMNILSPLCGAHLTV